MNVEDIFKDLPTLNTERLRLRKLKPEDAGFVAWDIKNSKAQLAYALSQPHCDGKDRITL